MANGRVGGTRNICGFCQKRILKSAYHKYIYPIPKCDAFPYGGNANDGAYACEKCAPKIFELQLEQGLIAIGRES